eukprot:m.65150 g.65150  ORF g.65150 m.65150 type:complete len:432 (-) comp8269_c0_seq1:2590-3885(-)
MCSSVSLVCGSTELKMRILIRISHVCCLHELASQVVFTLWRHCWPILKWSTQIMASFKSTPLQYCTHTCIFRMSTHVVLTLGTMAATFAAGTTAPTTDTATITAFDSWAHTYGRTYPSPSERATRYGYWRTALASARHGVHGLTPYSDRSPTELRAIFPPLDNGAVSGGTTAGPKPAPVYPFTAFSDDYVAKALQTGIDWREHNVVTPIKDQGVHGVCGTFGQTQAAESQYATGGGGRNPNKHPHPPTSFSEQQLLSCRNAVDPSEAYQFYHIGLESYDAYPFNESNWPDSDPPPCHFDKSKVVPDSLFTNTTTVPSHAGEDQLAAFVFHNGPMQVGINANIFPSKNADQFVTPEACAAAATKLKGIDHSLGVVGFNTTAEWGPYWIIKNSWGSKWGDHGFVYLARNISCGHFFSAGAHVYTYGPEEYYYE